LTPIATERWGEGVLRAARRLLMELLGGVGMGESVEKVGRWAIHMRRSLSPAEIATLSADWLAIPARDEFSEDGQMESRL